MTTPTRNRRRVGIAGTALIDQTLSSGTGLLLIILVARTSDVAVFGALSVAMIVNGLCLGLVRASVMEIVLLRTRRRPERANTDARPALLSAIGAGLLVFAGLAVTASVVGGDVGPFLVVVGAAAPFIYAQDLVRFLGYGTGRVERAVAADAAWIGVQVAGSAVLLATGSSTPLRLAAAWWAGAAVSAMFACARGRLVPSALGVRTWWREEHRRATGFVGDFVISTGMVQMSFIFIGVVLPLDEFGALRAAFVSLSPLANLLAGIRTLTLAHLGGLRDDPARAWRRATWIACTLAGAGAVYGTVLVLIPGSWGAQAFGETWFDARALVGFVAIGEVCRLSTFPAIDLMKVFGSPVALVRSRALAGVGVVSGLVLGALVAGPRGAAGAMAAGYGLAAVVWWRQSARVSRAPAQQAPVTRS